MSDSVKDEEAIPANTVLEAEIENDIVSEIDQAEQVSEIGDDLEADDDAFSSDPLQKESSPLVSKKRVRASQRVSYSYYLSENNDENITYENNLVLFENSPIRDGSIDTAEQHDEEDQRQSIRAPVSEVKEEKDQTGSPAHGPETGQQEVYHAYAREEGGGNYSLSNIEPPYRQRYSRNKHHPLLLEMKESCLFIKNNWQHVLHLPYLPFLSRPGWFLRYVLGLVDTLRAGSKGSYSGYYLFRSFFADFFAGVTVAITLIPQAISYAKLAKVPTINALYAAILPGAAYVIFGTSMHLDLGPVAVLSILTGQLVTRYGVNPYSQDAVDFAGEVALAVGTIFCALSIFNIGNLMRFVSYPVMSGLTTAVAMYMALAQLGDGFGFSTTVPQTGQPGYDYNYQVMQWFVDNWGGTYTTKTATTASAVGMSYQNYFAVQICFGLFGPLLLVQIVRNSFPPTAERLQSVRFHIWQFVAAVLPLCALVLGAHVAWRVQNVLHYPTDTMDNYYQSTLKVLGSVPSSLDFFRSPNLRWNFPQLLVDVIPLVLVSFMEGYSAAHRVALQKHELHFLNPSQELFATGVANFVASACSGCPVAGSFSRTALNAASDSRTVLSKAFTVGAVVITIAYLAQRLYYLPYAAITAVIWASVYNLVNLSDIWHAWKHSKKDFMVLVVTLSLVFIFNTGVGLAVGIPLSLIAIFLESQFSSVHSPEIKQSNCNPHNVKGGDGVASSSNIKLIVLSSDVNFLTVNKLVHTIETLVYAPADYGLPALGPAREVKGDEEYFRVTTAVDTYSSLPGKTMGYAHELPAAIVLDFFNVKIVDLTGLIRLDELIKNARAKAVKVVLFNVSESLAKTLTKYGIRNDRFSHIVNLDQFLFKAGNILLVPEDELELSSEGHGSFTLVENMDGDTTEVKFEF